MHYLWRPRQPNHHPAVINPPPEQPVWDQTNTDPQSGVSSLQTPAPPPLGLILHSCRPAALPPGESWPVFSLLVGVPREGNSLPDLPSVDSCPVGQNGSVLARDSLTVATQQFRGRGRGTLRDLEVGGTSNVSSFGKSVPGAKRW